MSIEHIGTVGEITSYGGTPTTTAELAVVLTPVQAAALDTVVRCSAPDLLEPHRAADRSVVVQDVSRCGLFLFCSAAISFEPQQEGSPNDAVSQGMVRVQCDAVSKRSRSEAEDAMARCHTAHALMIQAIGPTAVVALARSRDGV